jgi:hypothetical protein
MKTSMEQPTVRIPVGALVLITANFIFAVLLLLHFGMSLPLMGIAFAVVSIAGIFASGAHYVKAYRSGEITGRIKAFAYCLWISYAALLLGLGAILKAHRVV